MKFLKRLAGLFIQPKTVTIKIDASFGNEYVKFKPIEMKVKKEFADIFQKK